jgi:putative transposase
VKKQIEVIQIKPGKSTQNVRIESFNGRLREECLNLSWFQNLFDARRKIVVWRTEYNERRPQSSLATARRKSSRRLRQRASTRLSQRQGTQTPSLAPRAPPSRLKPKREQNAVVVLLRE